MRLAVFFSRGMSLAGWRRAGIFDREIALYRALLPQVEQLMFVTYGDRAEESALASALPGVEILPNRWGLPSNLYSVLAPLLHWRALSRATIFKTNQINGAWCAVIAKRLFGKKLVVRCGFLWSDFVARQHPGGWRQAAARRLEQWAFRAADLVIVATAADRDAIVRRDRIDPARVQVISNSVDTALFRPMAEVAREPGRITFVGRLDDQKNVGALIAALEGLQGATLVLVGNGPLRDCLQSDAAKRGVDATFLGTRPHAELPALLNRSEVFVLPSHYEGNPKALLEAMACGVPVVGADAPGIREIVAHRENGYLTGSSPGEIRAALQDVLGDAALRERISAGGVSYARAHCSLQIAVERELALLIGLAATA